MSSEPKVGPESDTDSMAEYGEGDTGNYMFILFWVDLRIFSLSFYSFIFLFFFLSLEGMNEDGSFIGQYGHNKRPASQGMATLV